MSRLKREAQVSYSPRLKREVKHCFILGLMRNIQVATLHLSVYSVGLSLGASFLTWDKTTRYSRESGNPRGKVLRLYLLQRYLRLRENDVFS